MIDENIIKIKKVGKLDIYFDGCSSIKDSIKIKDIAELNHEKRLLNGIYKLK